MNDRYSFLNLPVQKLEVFGSREDAEQRLAEVKKRKRFSKEHRSGVGTNGATFWINYTLR